MSKEIILEPRGKMWRVSDNRTFEDLTPFEDEARRWQKERLRRLSEENPLGKRVLTYPDFPKVPVSLALPNDEQSP